MKIKKTIITTAIVLMVSYVIKVEFIDSNELTADKIDTNKFIAQTKAQSKFKGDVKLKTKTKPIALAHINPLFEQLQPPADRDLEDLWQQEYGCYDQRDVENSDCQYTFLNASSLKEAMWMKRNGYPSNEMLILASEPDNQGLFKELLNAYYSPALVTATVLALDKKQTKKAMSLALSAVAYSSPDKSYPHVLYGEARYAIGHKELAIHNYMTAALLGDSYAESSGIALAGNKLILALGMKSAYSYLQRKFGNNFPVDARPQKVYVNQENEI